MKQALHYVNMAIADDPTMTNSLTMAEVGLFLTNYGNYKYNKFMNKRDIESLFYSLDLVALLKDCQNLPTIQQDWTYELIKFGSWHIKLYDNGIRIEAAYNNIIGLPMIPYEQIEAIEFDFFVDRSKLVGIWIKPKDYEFIRILCYKF